MALYTKLNKKIKNIFVNVNGTKKNVISAWVNRDGAPAKVFGIYDNSIIEITANTYVAKSRGQSFTLIVPEQNDISCTMTENDQVSLDENTVTVSDGSTIGAITPVKVQCDGKTYTVNVITAPDISDSSYEIYNSNDLVTLRTIVNYAAINDVNQNAKLMNDIDLSDVCSSTLGNWTAINGYHGIFNGQEHIINNLYMDVTGANYSGKYKTYVGLFGNTNSATIKNVTLNGNVTGRSESISYNMYVGGFCAYSNGTTFENLTNNCTVRALYPSSATTSAPYYAGGICGYGGGFVGCTNNGNVSGKQYSGGISGYGGSFIDCHNTATISSLVGNSGGISGQGNCTYCSNSGTVTSSSGVTGGIFAIGGTTVEYSYNTGRISSNGSMAGGICGNSGIINRCYNEGTITASGSSSSIYAGGIVGSSANPIANCYNKGVITGYNSAGGISGFHQSSGSIKNCYNVGQCKKTGSGTEYGGITGYFSNASLQLINCYVTTGRYYGGSIVPTRINCEIVDEETLKTYAEKLGDEFMDDINNINDGYPILKFQIM